uniref:Uncharacterized protein n=1 Tax=Knipowitschia caucasica TaxID=637954 RepID=A0AAV2KQ92_KNICA
MESWGGLGEVGVGWFGDYCKGMVGINGLGGVNGNQLKKVVVEDGGGRVWVMGGVRGGEERGGGVGLGGGGVGRGVWLVGMRGKFGGCGGWWYGWVGYWGVGGGYVGIWVGGRREGG